jgi:tetratricopeptide (TPR) repeat protein
MSGRGVVMPVRVRATMLGMFGLALMWARGATASPERDPADAAIVARLRADAPHAADLLERGESLAATGSLEEALRLFHEGWGQRPEDGPAVSLFGRRECEALTSLGRREEASRVCAQSMQYARSMPLVGATVRALVSGPTAPSFDDVTRALDVVAMERKFAPESPRLLAATCDIAESIGDGIMLQHCAEKLEQVAPDFGPTRIARARLRSLCPPWRFWGGWLAIALGAIVTLGDALRRLARRSRLRGSSGATAAAALFVATLAISGPARGDLPAAPPGSMLSKWPVDDRDPASKVPTPEQRRADPLEAGYWLQDVILKASIASKHGDHAAAIKYYQAAFEVVPERAVSQIKICDEYEAMGQIDNAANACGLALTLDGLSVNDYVHYVRLVLKRPGTLSDKELLALTNVINHLKEDEGGREAATQLGCELGVRTGDMARLKECVAALGTAAPDDPRTIMYQWAMAVQQSDYRRARQLLARAKTAGLSEESLGGMRQVTENGARHSRKAWALSVGGLLVLLGAAVYGLLSRARKRVVPAAATA